MLLTVITTTSRRIAVEGTYNSICTTIKHVMIAAEDDEFRKSANFVDLTERPNAFRYLKNKATVTELGITNPVRIYIDTITDIAMMTT